MGSGLGRDNESGEEIIILNQLASIQFISPFILSTCLCELGYIHHFMLYFFIPQMVISLLIMIY